MNRNTMRIGGVAVLAVLALGLGGTVAQASTTPALTITATTQEQQQTVRLMATALLNSPVEISAAERVELQAIANGESAAAGKFDGIVKLFKKIPGFAKAVAGSYNDFKAWYEGLSWYWKAPLTGIGLGGDLYSIWQLFH